MPLKRTGEPMLSPFAEPDRFDQIVEAQFGLGWGGLLGRGLGEGSPTRVPYAWSDFIITSLGEELGLAGLMAINNVMGQAERLLQNSAEGAGFIGIAVALMGRNHPVGVFLAAILFGFLYQGGAALGLETTIPIELRIVVQGLVILFTGALDQMVRMMLGFAFRARRA